jgi:hypothetical protein
MSNGPRIIFLRFTSSDSPKLLPWKAHYARVTGRAVTTPTAVRLTGEAPPVTWHLASANNRMLARSAQIFLGFDEAEADATATVISGAAFDVKLVSDAVRGLYGWYALKEETPQMTCARWYTTERDRRQSIALSLVSIPAAEVNTASRLVSPMTGGRSR